MKTACLSLFVAIPPTALGRLLITPDIQYRHITGPAGSDEVFSACVRLRIVI